MGGATAVREMLNAVVHDQLDEPLGNGALPAWLAIFHNAAFIAALVERTERLPEWCENITNTFTNKAATYAVTLAAFLRPGDRGLEVGSGIGFLSLWLHRQGIDVTPRDPAAGPFDSFGIISAAVIEHDGGSGPQVLRIGADALDPAAHGLFDLVCSFTVLEHIADLDMAFAAMAAVLAPGGRMVHVCPNYTFAYEPHLGIPLVPGAPALTARIVPAAVARQRDAWESLNFVTVRRIHRLTRPQGLATTFLGGQLHDQIERLWSDPEFAKRHFRDGCGRFVRAGLGAMRRIGLLALLRHVPPVLLAPVAFIVEKPGATP